jgi:hypothetical protein
MAPAQWRNALDAGGPLQVRAETRVESGFHFATPSTAR